MDKKPRYVYPEYNKLKFVSFDELRQLAKDLISTEPTWIGLIKIGIKLLCILIIFIIMKFMFDEEQRLGKQIYTQKTQDRDKNDLDDNMDGKKEGL